MRTSLLAVLTGLALTAPLAQPLRADGPTAEPEAAAGAEAALPAITVSAAAPAELVERVRASGLIQPVERVLVQPLVEGFSIEAIEAEVGDRVEAGQVLARLSDASLVLQRSQLEATRASAEATIAQGEAQIVEAASLRDQALRDRDRAQKLAADGATTAAAADTAASQAAAALARYNAAAQALNAARAQLRLVDAQIADVELQLNRTAVVAPVAGEVSERNANVGAIASMAGEPLFAIIRDGALELRADVAEQDVLALAPGQPASIRVVGRPDTIEGEIRLVEPTVDTTSRLGRVRIAISDPSEVRAGMFAEAEIRVRASDGLAVPVSAVGGAVAGGAASVLRVVGDRVEAAPIETGIRDGGRIEVTSGLAEGDLVVTKAGAFVRPGDRINPVPDGAVN